MKYIDFDYIPKGELTGFPLEVIDKMLERQIEQGNIYNIHAFENNRSSEMSGFNWRQTKEGYDFWRDIIFKKNFNLFFEKYPKEELQFPYNLKRGDRILVSNEEKSIKHKRIFLTHIQGSKDPFVCVDLYDENKYLKGEKFSTVYCRYAKPIPKEEIVELSLEEVANKLGIKSELLRIKK